MPTTRWTSGAAHVHPLHMAAVQTGSQYNNIANYNGLRVLLACNSPLEDGFCLLWQKVLDLHVLQCCHGRVMLLCRPGDAGEQLQHQPHRASCHFEQTAGIPCPREGREGGEGKWGERSRTYQQQLTVQTISLVELGKASHSCHHSAR